MHFLLFSCPKCKAAYAGDVADVAANTECDSCHAEFAIPKPIKKTACMFCRTDLSLTVHPEGDAVDCPQCGRRVLIPRPSKGLSVKKDEDAAQALRDETQKAYASAASVWHELAEQRTARFHRAAVQCWTGWASRYMYACSVIAAIVIAGVGALTWLHFRPHYPAPENPSNIPSEQQTPVVSPTIPEPEPEPEPKPEPDPEAAPPALHEPQSIQQPEVTVQDRLREVTAHQLAMAVPHALEEGNATVIRIEPDGIHVQRAAGLGKIEMEAMTEQQRDRYHIYPETAALYRQACRQNQIAAQRAEKQRQAQRNAAAAAKRAQQQKEEMQAKQAADQARIAAARQAWDSFDRAWALYQSRLEHAQDQRHRGITVTMPLPPREPSVPRP